MESKHIPLRAIATAAGVSVMTVSYALRNDPRVAAKTRERVQSIARQMRYRPDAKLSSLMHYLSIRRKKDAFDVLAFINRHSHEYFIENAETTRRFLAAAIRRSQELGYKLEVFWANDPGIGPARLSSILVNRGIQGVLVGPSYDYGTLEMDWDRFTAVALGFTLAAPNLHRVAANRYNNMDLALSRAKQRGYRRIGVVDIDNFDKRTNHIACARYLLSANLEPAGQRLPPLLMERWDPAAFKSWRNQYRPDAVIAIGFCLHRRLVEAGYRLPGDFGYLTLTNWDRTGKIAGVHPNIDVIGTTAIDMLVGQIHRNELGLPGSPRLTYLDGEWIDGETY